MHARAASLRTLLALLTAALPACSDDPPQAPADAGTDIVAPPTDRPPAEPVSTAHCAYEPLPATARAGDAVEPAPLRAGAAEAILDMPVGSALGAYTGRALSASPVDTRRVPYARGSTADVGFLPSTGYERAPRVRALALAAGEETVVILKADLGAADDSTTVDVASRLGPGFAGKVVFATSHSHSAWAQFVANEVLGLGFGRPRAESRRKLVDALVAAARAAIDSMAPARIGIAHDGDFDPMDRVNRDRRNENDDLPGGRRRKDRDLFVVRVDRTDGTPVAVMPVFGIHGTILGEDNNLASTEAPGAIDWLVEESFDRRVVVMHLQGAGGDVSPAGSGGIDCMGQSPCYNFARVESVGHYAVESVRAAWERAGAAMTDRVAMEMVTRAVPLGTDWRTFTVRDGGLSYAPFDGEREPDGVIFHDGGAVASPIDEFNAPHGAGLCGDRARTALPAAAQMPGTRELLPYKSCSRVEAVAGLFGPAINVEIPTTPCGATRTLLSALRINDHLFVTLPGEPVTLYADRLRGRSPVAPERTIVVGYAQGHMGYLLHPEDWLRGGYEPSINLWGPLEGEYIMERALELARLAVTPSRENAAQGSTLWRPPTPPPFGSPDPAPRAGTVPATVPATAFFPSTRRGAPRPASPQPDATVRRLGLARFLWVGEDPLAGTPRVTLQREMTAGRGDFAPVTRRSGRPVQDGDLLVAWTPDPLDMPSSPRTHHWVAEWQAVAPVGSAYPDDLSNRPGVPLGRYRFHVEGTGYTVDSDPFTVAPAELAVSASRSGASLQLTVGYESRTGWRLLDLEADSNRRVPLRNGAVDVTLTLADGTTRAARGMRTNAIGQLTVGDAASVRSAQVTDRHGNAGTATP